MLSFLKLHDFNFEKRFDCTIEVQLSFTFLRAIIIGVMTEKFYLNAIHLSSHSISFC